MTVLTEKITVANIVHYRQLMSQLIYAQNHKLENEDAILDDMDLIWNKSSSSDRETMRECLIFKEAKDFHAFNAAWKLYHANGDHKATFVYVKRYDGNEVRVKCTTLRPMHYLVHAVVNGVDPRKAFSPDKIHKDAEFKEALRALRRSYALAELQKVFGNTFTQEHLDKVNYYLRIFL